jgi:hypothetical protein
MNLKAVVEEFAERIQGLLEAQSMEKAKAEILGAFGFSAPRKPGRPPKAEAASATAATPVSMKARKKMPPQYCPVPYCRNVAAPIFGMVCAKHKDLPKAKVKQYREERRAKKDGVKVSAKKTHTKRVARVIKKTQRAAPVAKKTTRPTAKKMPMRIAKRAAKTRPSTKVTSPVSEPTPSVPPAA